jgi:hypothetical protein
MSITEEIFARLGLEGTHGIVTASAVLAAMFLLPCGPNASASVIPLQKPYYQAIEVSGSYVPACRIIMEDSTERHGYQARTALGERLMSLRKQAIIKGLTLLNADQIIEELRSRRGELS